MSICFLHAPCNGVGEGVSAYVYHKAEKFYNKAYQIFINIYGAYTVVKERADLPQYVHNTATAIGYIGVFDVPFAAARLFSNITALVDSRTVSDCLCSVLSTASEGCNALLLACEVVQASKDVGLVAQQTLRWIEPLTYLYLPSQLLMLAQSVEGAVGLFFFRQNFSLQYVLDNADHVQSTLLLSKKCDLKNINTRSAEVVQSLQYRVDAVFFLTVAECVTAALFTGASIAALRCVTSSFVTAIYTSTTVASIALAILNQVLLPKKPF